MIKFKGFLNVFVVIFIVANLIYLDYSTFLNGKESFISIGNNQYVPTPTPGDYATLTQVEDIIKAATASASVLKVSNTAPSSQSKEFFIHLGSGSSTSGDWEDVPGVEAYIDTSKYGKIRNAFFESSLYTPTGNQTAYVRLYNVNDKYAVWPSELSIEGGQPKLLISLSMELPSGNKLYRVQMKTQLKSRTDLVQARVRIVVE